MRKISEDPNISKEELKRVTYFALTFLVLLIIYIVGWTLTHSIWDCLVVMGLAFFGCVPAFLADAFMPLTGSIKAIPRKPIDNGKTFRGKRLFGENKTWNGLIGGFVLGLIVSLILAVLIYPYLYEATRISFEDGENVLEFISEAEILFFVDIETNRTRFILGQVLLCIGAPLGDLVGSFIKRQTNHTEGKQMLFVDQVDFILVAVLLAYVVFPLKWYYILFLVLVTPLITILANVIGYYLGAKKVPW